MKELIKFENNRLNKKEQEEINGGNRDMYWNYGFNLVRVQKTLGMKATSNSCAAAWRIVKPIVQVYNNNISANNGKNAFYFRQGANYAWRFNGGYCGSRSTIVDRW